MTLIAKSCLKVFLMAFAAELHFSFALQSPQSPQPQPLQQSDAVSLQQLLDRDAYIAYLQALPHVSADKLTEQQRAYFLGMLAFHVGKLDEAAQLLTKGVNTNDKSLTSSQVESAL